MNPIIIAVRRGYLEVVKELLNRGANVNTRDKRYGMTLIAQAAYKGELSIVKELIKRGANVNLRDGSGETPLMGAAYEGELSIVKELIKAGADVSAQSDGWDALTYAALERYTGVIRYLVEKGANTNTALNHHNMNYNMKNYIIKHKAGLTIAKYKKALNMRRRLSFIGSNKVKSLPRNVTRKILLARKN